MVDMLKDIKVKNESKDIPEIYQEMYIYELIEEILTPIKDSIGKRVNEFEEFVAKYNYLLAIGQIKSDEDKENIRNAIYLGEKNLATTIKRASRLLEKLVEFRDGQFKK